MPVNDNRPAREWFTAAELAELALPGLARDKRSIHRRAEEERWADRCDLDGGPLARMRKGRGGAAYEYHFSILPEATQVALRLKACAANEDDQGPKGRENLWAWYDNQSGKVKAEAEKRLAIILEAETLHNDGHSKVVIADELARRHSISPSTVWNYFKLIKGVPRQDWLPTLAPRRKGGGAEAEIDHDLWKFFLSDYCRLEEPPLSLCYERTAELAQERGIPVPHAQTFRRRLKKEMHPRVLERLRKGKEASRRAVPAQRRSVEHLDAMQCVNIDGHKFDVWVTTPDGKKMRPILLGIQDIRSSKLLAWRVVEVESAHYVRLVFGDLFEKWGIPQECVLDNGRGFASKWITGRAAFRFRNKVKPEDPVGLIVKMGIKEHWALPYHGQSKPIERAWRDLTNRIARHAFCTGAYTGPNPMKKPENAGKRSIPWDEFVAFVDRQVAKHNAKLGRTGRDYKGRSFDQVFAQSYETSSITKATPEQLRMAMLAVEKKRLNTLTGELEIFGNRYWSEDCGLYHGERVIVRFDPGNLTKPVHLYDMNDAYLCSAEPWGDVKFLDAESARKTGKFVAEQKRRIRDGIDAEDLLEAREVAAMEVGEPAAVKPEAGAVRILQTRGNAALKAQVEVAPSLPTSSNKIISLFGRLRPEE